MSLFYSKSKNLDLRYLSNFEKSKVSYKGKSYPSVESGFQGLKYFISGCKEVASKFELGGKYENLDSSEIKKLGGKGGFKKNKCELDVDKWNKESVGIMRKLLESRYDNDIRFKTILDGLNVKLFHFERSGVKSFWGGNWEKNDIIRNKETFRGQNKLGELLDGLKDVVEVDENVKEDEEEDGGWGKWEEVDEDEEEDSDYDYQYKPVQYKGLR